MCSSHGDSAAAAGFPHSEIHGSMSAFDYPWHIADRCVLRRLLVPRHSPCTLCSLTCDLSFFTRRKFVDLPFFGSSSFTSCFASLSSLFSFQGTLERINPPDRFRSHGGLKFESHSAFQLMCFSHFRRRSLARSLVGSSSSHTLPFSLCVSLTFATDRLRDLWWAQVDSNHRPRAYQARALTN